MNTATLNTKSANPVILKGKEGRHFWVWDDLYTVKITGNESNGAYALIECAVQPQSGTPPHIHHAEAEMFYILAGELTVWVADQRVQATAGSYVYIPQGTVHCYKNESQNVVTMLASMTPAGFEQFLIAIGDETDGSDTAPPVTPQMIEEAIRLAPKYRMEVLSAL